MWSKHPRVTDRLAVIATAQSESGFVDSEFDAPPAQRGGRRLLEGSADAFARGDDNDDGKKRWFTAWDSRARKAALAVLAGLALVIAWWWWSGQPQAVQSVGDSIEVSGDVDLGLALEEVSGTVLVHVVGKVTQPGVVELPIGSRVQDAIEAAGGATKDKALESVNLARPVVDGEQIIVGAPADSAQSSTISINSADAARLQELPGVGPVIAERIVQWREKNGPFQSIDELTEISGIGPSMIEQIRDMVGM